MLIGTTLALALLSSGPAFADDLTPAVAEEVRDAALAEAGEKIGPDVQLECTDPAARCGFTTVQASNNAIVDLLNGVDSACKERTSACAALLEELVTTDDGQKRARIRLVAASDVHP